MEADWAAVDSWAADQPVADSSVAEEEPVALTAGGSSAVEKGAVAPSVEDSSVADSLGAEEEAPGLAAVSAPQSATMPRSRPSRLEFGRCRCLRLQPGSR